MKRTSPLQTYLDQVGRHDLLTAEAERALARDVKAGDPQARERMITANLRLVVSVATRFKDCGLALDDLVEEGNIGLVKAVERFDPARGTRFSTYATFWIRQTILHALRHQTRLVRVPVHVQRRGDVLASQTSLDAIESDPPATTDDTEARLIAEEDREQLAGLLTALDSRRRRIIELRFGLGDQPRMTLQQIASRLRLSRERVRQLAEDALQRMRAVVRRQRVARVGAV